MDVLDRLTRRLMLRLDDEGERPAAESSAGQHPGGCVDIAVVANLAEGRLDPSARRGVERHLDSCLACLYRFVEVRDCLHGVAAPAPLSPRLAATLETLLAPAARRGPRVPGAWTLQRALRIRVPAWAAAATAAALVLVTWTTAYRPGPVDGPPALPPGAAVPPAPRLEPAYASASRTLSGIVRSVRDVTSQGVTAHVVSLEDGSGVSYVLFTWGSPTVRPGDTVDVEAILTDATRVADAAVYQGIAIEVRHGK